MSRQTQGRPNKPNCALIRPEVGRCVQLCDGPSHIDQLLLYHRDAADHGRYGTGPQPDSRRRPLPVKVRGECRPENLDGCTSEFTDAGRRPLRASCVVIAVLSTGSSGRRLSARCEPTTRRDLWRVGTRRARPQRSGHRGLYPEGVNGDETAVRGGCRHRYGPTGPTSRSTRPTARCIIQRPPPESGARGLTRPRATTPPPATSREALGFRVPHPAQNQTFAKGGECLHEEVNQMMYSALIGTLGGDF